MAVNGPPRAAGGRVAAARRGRCPAPLRCIEGVYSRYCKAGATLAGIGVRAGQEPFRGSATHNRSSLAGAQIALICMAARLHRLDPAAAQAGRRAFSRTAPLTQRHTVGRHHLEADLRSSTGWTGLPEDHGSLVEVHAEAASSSTGTSCWNSRAICDMHEGSSVPHWRERGASAQRVLRGSADGSRGLPRPCRTAAVLHAGRPRWRGGVWRSGSTAQLRAGALPGSRGTCQG